VVVTIRVVASQPSSGSPTRPQREVDVSAAHGVAEAVAGYGISPHRARLPESPLPSPAWDDLLGLVLANRLTGLLHAALRDGALAATTDQREAAASLHSAAVLHSLKLEGELVALSDRMHRAGIAHRVLKGPSLAHTIYPDPALRPFFDIDLLVPSAAFDGAVALVRDLGGSRSFAQPRPGFDMRFAKGANLVVGDVGIDLHRTLALGPFGLTVDLDELICGEASFELAGCRLPCLDAERAFLAVAIHAALGDSPPKLIALRDLAQMATTRPLDTATVRLLASSWQVEAPVALAVRAAWSILDLPDHALARWARSFRPSARDARWLSLYLGPDRRYRPLALAAVGAIPGLRSKATYLRALALPDRPFLDAREGTYLGRWCAALAETVRATGRSHPTRRADPADSTTSISSGPTPREGG
jgi:hypothetical protein